jgi:tRNA pseudouridine38-40 synthase
MWNAPHPLPLLSRYSLHVPRKLDTEAMSRAAAPLVGTHDLAAFAGQGLGVPDDPESDAEDRPSTVRTVYLARLVALPETASFWAWDAPEGEAVNRSGVLWALDLVANAFLPQMVRTIVGTLLEVGLGKRTVDSIGGLIDSRDRRQAGPTAKPHGLCLLWVGY